MLGYWTCVQCAKRGKSANFGKILPHPSMPFRPPLTADELRAIKERNADLDVRALLWEVARLRNLARAASQVLPMCSPVGDTARMLYKALQSKLDEEACVIEHKARIAELLKPDVYQRSSDDGLEDGRAFQPRVRRR